MRTSITGLVAVAGLGIATAAAADPIHNMCVPPAANLPTFEGPPNWDAPAVAAPPLDDPRWTGATQQAFEIGGATAPLHARAVWFNQPDPSHSNAATDFLFLQFIVDVENISGASIAGPRDLFVSFRRSSVFNTEHGYMFQFHLTGANATPFVTPTYCSAFDQCDETTTTKKDFWRLFIDHGNKLTCGGATTTAETFDSAGTTPGLDLTKSGAVNVAYWKVASTGPMQNRWAVEIRLPLADAGKAISEGIDRTSTMWYEATTQMAAGDYANIAWWPKEDANPICVSSDPLLGDFVNQPDLASADSFTNLTLLTNPKTPANHPACDGGLSIHGGDIGSMPNATLPIDPNDPAHPHPPNQFLSSSTATPIVNDVVAFPENTSTADITAPLRARFRLASWGSAPWSMPADHGKWKDLRGAENGVCASGTAPSCNDSKITAGKRGVITFKWTIGETGNPMGDSEYCKYGLAPPITNNTKCLAGCTCDATQLCDAVGDPGIQAVNATTNAPVAKCVSKLYQYDQCLLVELDTSAGTTTTGTTIFESQSAWNNMTFGEMSILTREALIDARELPVAPGQTDQNIYFVVMPRNMPATVPAGSTTVSLINDKALALAKQIAQPYIDGAKGIEAGRLAELTRVNSQRAYKRPPGKPPIDEQALEQVEKVLQLMPQPDFDRATRLIGIALGQGDGAKPAAGLVKQAVTTLGPGDAAAVVPTLEVYPYYQQNGKGHAFLPMTGFTVFLSHEGSLGGIHYEIDGADRVSDNVFHMKIPVHYARRIQIRAQALVPPEVVEVKGNPRWPCGCCGAKNCGLVAGLGNMGPGLAAGVFAFSRRRRKKKSSETQTQTST